MKKQELSEIWSWVLCYIFVTIFIVLSVMILWNELEKAQERNSVVIPQYETHSNK